MALAPHTFLTEKMKRPPLTHLQAPTAQAQPGGTRQDQLPPSPSRSPGHAAPGQPSLAGESQPGPSCGGAATPGAEAPAVGRGGSSDQRPQGGKPPAGTPQICSPSHPLLRQE